MKAALLLVDLQADFLAATGLQPAAERLIDRASALVETCRRQPVPVMHIWTTIHRGDDRRLPHWKKTGRWWCVDGTSGHKPPASLMPKESEIVVQKSGFNGFASGELEAALRRLGCDTVMLTGMHLHTCVRTAAAESLERGLQVVIVEDAVATDDPVYAAATRRWLAARGVEFISTSEVQSLLDANAVSSWSHRSPRETTNVLFTVPIADESEVVAATVVAQAAGGPWRQKDLNQRCRILDKLAAQLDAFAPEMARQMAVEIGKPVAHGLEEMRRAAENIRDVIGRAVRFEFQKNEAAGRVRHEPMGVVALISPWNNPVAIPLGKIAPALIYGNTVVWKPAPAATRIASALLHRLQTAGLPADAVRLLTGDHSTAQHLAADPCVNAVTLTGSAAAGHAIQEICARRFLPLQAELSGNNAAIVWDDADLPAAARQVAWAAFGFAGQRCTANRRVIVSAARLDSFWSELKSAAGRLNWGDPLDPATDIGPVIHAGKRDEQAASILAAQNSGAVRRCEFLLENRIHEPWIKTGAYARPVMVGCDQPDHPLVQEETMSPLLVVQPAENFEHALSLCNGVRHGLVASLFSRSPERQKAFLAEARAGILKINQATAGVDVSLPFGGWKMSGLGPPEHGNGDWQFYTRMQAIYGLEAVSNV